LVERETLAQFLERITVAKDVSAEIQRIRAELPEQIPKKRAM
jgi:hypothetical protein